MRVYIMRGLPGSGKSTWVKNYFIEPPLVVSADHYHMVDECGKYVYRFKPENARIAHDATLRGFAQAMDTAYADATIIVDNTNISVWELAPYYRLAEAFGAEVEIVLCECTVEESITRNVHEVPEATIRGMYARLQAAELPPWWKQTRVNTSAKPTN